MPLVRILCFQWCLFVDLLDQSLKRHERAIGLVVQTHRKLNALCEQQLMNFGEIFKFLRFAYLIRELPGPWLINVFDATNILANSVLTDPVVVLTRQFHDENNQAHRSLVWNRQRIDGCGYAFGDSHCGDGVLSDKLISSFSRSVVHRWSLRHHRMWYTYHL